MTSVQPRACTFFWEERRKEERKREERKGKEFQEERYTRGPIGEIEESRGIPGVASLQGIRNASRLESAEVITAGKFDPRRQRHIKEGDEGECSHATMMA